MAKASGAMSKRASATKMAKTDEKLRKAIQAIVRHTQQANLRELMELLRERPQTVAMLLSCIKAGHFDSLDKHTTDDKDADAEPQSDSGVA